MTSEPRRRRGRPPSPLDPDASSAARLGAELRALRLEQGLTLGELGCLISYSPQYVSEVERANGPCSRRLIEACDRALNAGGALLELLPGVAHERAMRHEERDLARRASALRLEAHCEVVGDDVHPTNRRGLIGAGASAALGLGVTAMPAQARDVDPELPGHWGGLLEVIGRHDAAFGPYEVLDSVRREVILIAQHRQLARGELQLALMRVESRWAGMAAWLSNDKGEHAARDAWTTRALQLAQEANYPDMAAFARWQQTQWAAQERDGRRAIALAESGLRIPGTSAQVRALCSSWAAIGYALADDAPACERHIAAAYGLTEHSAGSPAPPWAGQFLTTPTYVRMTEARCWLPLQPRKAIGLYESALRDWPRSEPRSGGLHQARLALCCAAAGERDRAIVEGRRAQAVARRTKSHVIASEIQRLRETLGAS